MSHHPQDSGNYEKTDIWMGLVWTSLAGLAFFIVFGIGLSYLSYVGLEKWFNHSDKALAPMIETNVAPPEPRLQVLPADDLKAFNENQQKPLHQYEVVDQEAGKARIPVARAMEILVENKGIKKQQEGTVKS